MSRRRQQDTLPKVELFFIVLVLMIFAVGCDAAYAGPGNDDPGNDDPGKTSEPLTREKALDIWRAEQLIVRTSPEWRHTMFDTFPAVALVTLHAGQDDVGGFLVRNPDVRLTETIGPVPILVVEVLFREAMLRLLRDAGVAHVGPNAIYTPQLSRALPMINPLPGGQGGAGTTIAVIDTGLLSTSPVARSGRIAAQVNANGCTGIHKDLQDRDGHGTAMVSIAAAAAPRARLVSLKAVDCQGRLDSLQIYKAQTWVYENAEKYNIVAAVMSFAADTLYAGVCTTSDTGMLFHLVSRGVVPVAASGNVGWKTGLPAPACGEYALAVGMLTSHAGPPCLPGQSNCAYKVLTVGEIPAMSNSGPRLALVAPGGIISDAGWTASMFGTSLAAPFVAGGIAAAQAVNKRPGAAMLAAARAHGGAPLKDAGNNLSRPRLNVQALVAEAASAPGAGATAPGAAPVAAVVSTTPTTVLASVTATVVGGCTSCH